MTPTTPGRVALVGAGPGDPGLLTVRGRELLATADAVVLDRLGTARLLPFCRSDARLIDAGKAPGVQAMTQAQTNQTLVDLAREGLNVVRLKGGDPFVFGRGGEEALALRDAGIPYEVVPGITSAIAAPAYAGIPVTHRAVSTSFTVVTGHESPNKHNQQTDWDALAAVPGTLVILMGMGRLQAIAQALMDAGRPPYQPAAAVQWGTTGRQRHVVATLATLRGAVTSAGLGNPAVIIVGDVAGLSEEVGWWSAGPLAGSTVVVTRARAQASELSPRLEALGAEVIELPVIRIEPRPMDDTIAGTLDAIESFQTIILTSANGVDQLFARLRERGLDARAIPRTATVVAVGPATAERLRANGVTAGLVPERAVAEGVLDALSGHPVAGTRVLLARASEGRSEIVTGLIERDADVVDLALYDTVAEPADPSVLARVGEADHVTFTSSSTVRRFVELMGGDIGALSGLRVASIGPVTSATARELGLEVHVEAGEHTIDGLIAALVESVGA